MRKVWLTAAAFTLSASGAAGVKAGEPSELSCIAASYTSEQQSRIDALLPDLDLLFQKLTTKLETVSLIVTNAAWQCASANDWNDSERQAAFLHELGRLAELTQRRHGLLTGEDFDRVDRLLATGDREALWTVLERHLGIGLSGSQGNVTRADAILMGRFLVETGVGPEQAKLDQVSVYLATKTMQRMSARDFAVQ